jgi:sortase A
MTAATLDRSEASARAARFGATTDLDAAGVDAEWSADEAPPPLNPRLQLIRAVLVLILVLSTSVLIQLSLISSLQASAAQGKAFDKLRGQFAAGTAPVGPDDSNGHEVPIGTPIAYLEIPEIGLKQVVGQGTTPSALFTGPGHRRDTPLPGQIGTSIILGRRAAFGGAFSDIDELRTGDRIKVTTGQGEFNFTVIDTRGEGDPAPPPPASGAARLVLITATGPPFLPDGVIRVDAELDGKAVVGARPRVTAKQLPGAETIMGSDSSTLWALALWLQALIALSIAFVWAWHRWGHAQAWVAFLPPLALVGLMTTSEISRLLPNLL